MPQTLADVVDDGAVRTGDSRSVLEHDAQRDGVLRQNSRETHMVHDETRHLLRASRQKNRGAFHPGYRTAPKVGQEPVRGLRRTGSWPTLGAVRYPEWK